MADLEQWELDLLYGGGRKDRVDARPPLPWPVAAPTTAAVILEPSRYSWSIYLSPDGSGERRFPVLTAYTERAARVAAEAIAAEWSAPLIVLGEGKAQ